MRTVLRFLLRPIVTHPMFTFACAGASWRDAFTLAREHRANQRKAAHVLA